jgi:putative hydrolase of the HAD superfamily
MMRPKGLLVDYGGTLVKEISFDLRAGNEWLLGQASYQPPDVTLDDVLERASRVAREVAESREGGELETAWPTLARLIHDFFGIRFDLPMSELELGFWKASMRTLAMPGARAALEHFHRMHVPIAVVSNTSFGGHVIRYELDRHGLADHLEFVMASADYCVRKPNRLLFETAAARLGVDRKDIWFMGDRLDTDIVGAKAAGMTAVWFCPAAGQDSQAHAADWVVAHWRDLAGKAT